MKAEESQPTLQASMAGAIAQVELALGEARRELLELRAKAARCGLDSDVFKVQGKFAEAQRIAAQARLTIQGVRAPVQLPALSELQAEMLAEDPEPEGLLEATYAGASEARAHRLQYPDRRMLAAGDDSLDDRA
jgi:hypothetical protein